MKKICLLLILVTLGMMSSCRKKDVFPDLAKQIEGKVALICDWIVFHLAFATLGIETRGKREAGNIPIVNRGETAQKRPSTIKFVDGQKSLSNLSKPHNLRSNRIETCVYILIASVNLFDIVNNTYTFCG